MRENRLEMREFANQWRCTEGIWISKEEGAKRINQFRYISPLNVEGKIFFSLLNRRLSDHILKNEYIDTAVQKGEIPGMPGYIEHTGTVSQLLKDAKRVTWLSYGWTLRMHNIGQSHIYL